MLFSPSFRPGALANAAAAGLALAAGLARAADNDVVLDAIDVLCANPRGSIGETVKLVMRSPLQAREVAAEQKPYGREIYLAKLGATLTLLSKSRPRRSSSASLLGTPMIWPGSLSAC